jgi:hypothetical protein
VTGEHQVLQRPSQGEAVGGNVSRLLDLMVLGGEVAIAGRSGRFAGTLRSPIGPDRLRCGLS